MTTCPTTETLSAYHDGELDVTAADDVRSHVSLCARCGSELNDMKALSTAISEDAQTIDALPIELARIQAKVRMSVTRADASASIRRTAALLGTMAASLLIISAAWLIDPERGAVHRPADGLVMAAPDWERLASTLHAEPRPGVMGEMSPYSLRYAAVVDWMLQNHVPLEHKPWEKPL